MCLAGLIIMTDLVVCQAGAASLLDEIVTFECRNKTLNAVVSCFA